MKPIMVSSDSKRYGRGLILVMPVLGVLALSAAAQGGLTDGVKKAVLPNGLTVLVLENHKAPVATLNVFYRVGSRNERFGHTGLSHLLEHLMFRGTKKLAPEEFSNIIQESGGRDNAFTTADFTDYFEIINRAHLDVPIYLEADRMANFAPKGFASEKDVVIEERRLRTDDNPEDALYEATQAQAYVEHPYHWPVIGWMHDIQGLTLKDALDYHAIYYSPQNAIVVAVGDFNADHVMSQIRQSFAPIKNQTGPPPPVTEIEPPQQGERRLTLEHAADLPVVAEGYHVPNHANASDAFALELASQVLAGGKSSRLYRDLVEQKRLVVDVDADYDMTAFDPTMFWFTAQMRPGVQPQAVIQALDQEVAQLANTPVGARELQKAKNQEQASFVYGQDSVFREAMMLGQYEMIGGYKQLDLYIPSIDKVTAADIQRVVRKYLVPSNLTLGILKPTGLLPHPAGGGAGGPVSHAPAAWGSPS
ncbi:MAG TPA: pitrilysin family protein [Candidatus Binataceae bacterium]|nr:pitrilysin family protein [Candidatus Binataceae bacterium]